MTALCDKVVKSVTFGKGFDMSLWVPQSGYAPTHQVLSQSLQQLMHRPNTLKLDRVTGVAAAARMFGGGKVD